MKVRDYNMAVTKKGKARDKFAVILQKAKALMDDPSATIFGVLFQESKTAGLILYQGEPIDGAKMWNELGPQNFQED
jgi:hypothetical protein